MPVIKTIAIVPATNPSEFTLANESALQFLIPLAATANYVDSKEKAKQFNERLRPQELDLAKTLTESIANSMRARGYNVVILENVNRPKDSPDDIDYEKVSTSADAILHISISGVGLHSPRSSTSYLPRLNVNAVLYVKGRDDYIYDSYVYYGVDAQAGKSWAIESDPSFAYPSFESVTSSIANIGNRFKSAALSVTERLTSQIYDSIK